MSTRIKYLAIVIVWSAWLAGLVLAVPSTAAADPANAPNAHFIFGAEIFQNGQSENIGPSALKILDEGLYWFEGDCTGANGRQDCDLLRFGAAYYAGQCYDGDINQKLPSAEDGGEAVQNDLKHAQDSTGRYCADSSYRPLDESLLDHQNKLFGAGQTDARSRPNLNLLVLSDLPQTADRTTIFGYDADERAKKTLATTCAMLYGYDGTTRGAWPSMPSWVMMARQHAGNAATYGGLLSAAGGTGECCYDATYSQLNPLATPCDPTDPAQRIDICSHVVDWLDPAPPLSEQDIRRGVASGKFQCAQGDAYVQTGSMDFGARVKGTQPDILCHFAGENGHSNCHVGSRKPTDVLGKMACIRQLPEDYDGGAFKYCDRWGHCTILTVCDDDIDDDGTANDTDPCPYDAGYTDASNCPTAKSVDECAGVEFIDPNKTLFSLKGVEGGQNLCGGLASGGEVHINSCPNEGQACSVDTNLNGTPAYGRCTVGEIYCDADGNEICGQLYNPMPEICNGLDDDCNGEIDNLSTSWHESAFRSYDPTELGEFDADGVDREAIHCLERNVCTCQGGTLDYGGPGYEAHIMSWVPGTCVCGEALEVQSGGPPPGPPSERNVKPQVGCSSTGSGAGTIGWLLIGGLGLMGFRRRRE